MHPSKRLFPEQHVINADVRRRAHLSVRFVRLCDRAGLDGLTFHSLRHGFAKRLRAAGVAEESIGAMMGHRNVQTTNGYGKR